MKLLLPISNWKRMLGVGLLLAIITLSTFKVAIAQPEVSNIPHLPILSLTGNEQYDRDYYPDGRLWVPPTSGEPREFLMPVFVVNRWYTYYYQPGSNYTKFIADPIKSFKFSIFYNGRSVRAVGVETTPPEYYSPDDNEPIAKNFTFDVDDAPDANYWKYLNETKWGQSSFNEKNDGRRFTITASSSQALPTTLDAEINQNIWQVLLYVRFRVLATVKEGNIEEFNRRTPIYINPDDVRYNNVNVIENSPVALMSDYDQQLYQIYYPQPEPAIDGIRNDNMAVQTWYNIEPYKPGTIFLNIFDRLPEFGFQSERSGEQFTKVEEGIYNLNLPIMVDSNSVDNGIGSYELKLVNLISGTRLSYIEIDTDQEWLEFRSISKGASSKDPIPVITRSYLYRNYRNPNLYIDNGILGSAKVDPRGVFREADKDLWLELRANPNRLNLADPTDPEKAGLYEGTVTFKSPFAGINPVKLNVRFWYFRNPYEPAFAKQNGNPGGINLSIYNSDDDEIDMVFGTGHRATSGVDFLFGEATYNGALSTTQFDARWYPTEEPYITDIPNGFGDIAPNIDNPRTNSRDIRDYNDSKKSHIFLCKFNAGGASKYPIVLKWNVNDFPANANLFIRDSYQGQFFPAANMRFTTEDPNEAGVRYFVISNPNLDRFIIEYTLPTNQDYVDYDGNPLIKLGWNFLSLPLRPENPKWDEVYKEGINIPYFFSKNQYQQPDDGILKVGLGYFVKYGTFTDELFSGSLIEKIDPAVDRIRVYPSDTPDPDNTDGGWNSIGSISTPVTIDHVCFTDYNGELPDPSFTNDFGVWAYATNRGYFEVTRMLPGLGYWIKTDKNGYLKINPEDAPCVPYDKSIADEKSLVKDASTSINVRDNVQREYTLYVTDNQSINHYRFQLPPVPSEGYFDVRFDDNTYLNNQEESVIRLQDAQYPVVLNVNNADAEYTFTDAITGEVLGTVLEGSSASIIVESTLNNAIRVQKTGAGLSEFGVRTYPNPVVSNATVDYTITQNTVVSISLVDALGNVVMNVVDAQNLAAGSYSANIDATTLANGSYLVKFSAGDKVTTAKLNVVK